MKVFGIAALLALGLATAACETTGVGTGTSRTGAVTASLTWRATGAEEGDMTAVVDSGRTYAGKFYQITRETTVEEIRPLWTGYGPRWRRWGAWGPEPSTAFITEYTGRVVANLAGPDGNMRCRFRLIRPSEGMSGGGAGRCQLPDGTDIRATFPPM
jgi:hypothetical protein